MGVRQLLQTAITRGALATALMGHGLAGAGVAAVANPGAFPVDTRTTGFDGMAIGTAVHGLEVGGITFTYSLGPDKLFIGQGPGDTHNVNTPSIVSFLEDSGTLSLQLAQPAHWFGFGFALLATNALANGSTVSVFAGTTLLGTLTFAAALDPSWPGGFAGLFSEMAFDRVDLVFNSQNSDAFAADNFRVSAVPEPAAWALLLAGMTLVAARARCAAR